MENKIFVFPKCQSQFSDCWRNSTSIDFGSSSNRWDNWKLFSSWLTAFFLSVSTVFTLPGFSVPSCLNISFPNILVLTPLSCLIPFSTLNYKLPLQRPYNLNMDSGHPSLEIGHHIWLLPPFNLLPTHLIHPHVPLMLSETRFVYSFSPSFLASPLTKPPPII